MKPAPLRALALVSVVAALSTGASANIPPPAADAPATLADLTAVEQQLARLEAEEKNGRAALATLAPQIQVIHARMVARGRVYTRHLRAGLLPVSGGFDALVEHANRVERTRRALERDVELEQNLREREKALTERLIKLASDRVPLRNRQESLSQMRDALNEAAERNAAFDRAFENSTRPPDYVAVYGAGIGPADPGANEGFRSQKGRLPLPLGGRAEVRQVPAADGFGPGLELVAPAGTAVRAVAPGRVVFADRYERHGLTVILDHGDKYHSVSGHLGSLDVKVGDALPAGARLGTVGQTAKGPMLYFELRQAGQTINPNPWLGL